MTHADRGTPEGGPARITFNASRRANTALSAITAATDGNRTDAINFSLRLCATLLDLSHPDGSLHILTPDGRTHVVHLP
jgi:hypothetical protein